MQTDQTIDRLERLLAETPSDLPTWLSLIEAWLQRGDIKEALRAVRDALDALGEHEGLLRLCLTLEQSLTEAAPAPEPWADELRALTQRIDDRGQADGVAEVMQFTATWPESAGGWALLAECRAALDQDADAVAAIEHALRLEPKNARWQAYFGTLLKRLGDLDAAEARFRAALDLDP